MTTVDKPRVVQNLRKEIIVNDFTVRVSCIKDIDNSQGEILKKCILREENFVNKIMEYFLQNLQTSK